MIGIVAVDGADGMTKLGVRQQFVDKLLRGVHALRRDPTFTARKRMSKRERP